MQLIHSWRRKLCLKDLLFALVMVFLSHRSVIRAENAAAWRTGVLRGPNGYLPAPITTRDQLLEATSKFSQTISCCVDNLIFGLFIVGDELDALDAHLGGVQDYPAGGSVPAKREALAAYLGVVL